MRGVGVYDRLDLPDKVRLVNGADSGEILCVKGICSGHKVCIVHSWVSASFRIVG